MAVCGDSPLALSFPCFPRRMYRDPNIGLRRFMRQHKQDLQQLRVLRLYTGITFLVSVVTYTCNGNDRNVWPISS